MQSFNDLVRTFNRDQMKEAIGILQKEREELVFREDSAFIKKKLTDSIQAQYPDLKFEINVIEYCENFDINGIFSHETFLFSVRIDGFNEMRFFQRTVGHFGSNIYNKGFIVHGMIPNISSFIPPGHEAIVKTIIHNCTKHQLKL